MARRTSKNETIIYTETSHHLERGKRVVTFSWDRNKKYIAVVPQLSGVMFLHLIFLFLFHYTEWLSGWARLMATWIANLTFSSRKSSSMHSWHINQNLLNRCTSSCLPHEQVTTHFTLPLLSVVFVIIKQIITPSLSLSFYPQTRHHSIGVHQLYPLYVSLFYPFLNGDFFLTLIIFSPFSMQFEVGAHKELLQRVMGVMRVCVMTAFELYFYDECAPLGIFSSSSACACGFERVNVSEYGILNVLSSTRLSYLLFFSLRWLLNFLSDNKPPLKRG